MPGAGGGEMRWCDPGVVTTTHHTPDLDQSTGGGRQSPVRGTRETEMYAGVGVGKQLTHTIWWQNFFKDLFYVTTALQCLAWPVSSVAFFTDNKLTFTFIISHF